ncbi:hypothetical protein OPKNFCMD_3538 [Methylobacterium crusticola]|uniref:DUF1989 domain-containing protein n=1 Tax=Methylobacterium crusticola TaxID=1697972 RepID=A0ABQ4R033_9HYPH|nr:urea amidolyase associated protein UAAP1 [Methylobacterium crusticola]GJD50792.1 hypothetical protein OPKNFCMD_3538 [Methylobacterium crusticola]
MSDAEAVIARNRARYEALRAGGQEAAPKALPPPTDRSGAPIPDGAVIHHETVPGGWYWTTALRRGEALRLRTPGGDAAAALIAWRRDDPSERLNAADTVKVQWSAALRRGRILLSDMGRVMLSLIEDTSGAHDALVGGSRGDAGLEEGRTTRGNFLAAVGKLGLTKRDIPPCVTFFAPVSVGADGRFVWDGTRRSAGDFVDLRAEMDLLVAVSNCRHPLDPETVPPGPLEAVRFRAPAPAAHDPCRSAGPEAARAFAHTDRLHA